MKKNYTNESFIRFRRWQRKGYAAFESLHRQVQIGVLSFVMSLVLLATPEETFAYTIEPDSLQELDIDEVVVSGNILSPTRTAVLPIPVFNRADEAAPLPTVESALRLAPSVDLRERGGKGVQADISIRGGSFDQTVVMLNGIDFSDARTGHQSHSVPVDMGIVSSIAIEDGTTGVGAFAGVVHLRTEPLRPTYVRAEASGGQYGYAYGNLSGAVTKGSFTIFGAGSYRASNGYIDNTDFTNYNAYLRAGYDAGRAGYFDWQGGYQSRGFGANGFYSLRFPNQFEATRTFLTSLRWQKQFGKRFTLESNVNYRKNLDRFELVRNDASAIPFNYHNTDRVGASVRGDYLWAWGTTSLYSDYRYDHIYSSVLGELLEKSRRIKGRDDAFYTHGKSRHSGDVRLRHIKVFRQFDIEGSVGGVFTPYGTLPLWSASAGVRPVSGLHIGAAAVRSMRMPTYTDLYYTTTGYVGNAHLKPEKATTYRLRAEYKKNGLSTEVEIYYRNGKDIIDWVRETPTGDWQSQQITSLGTLGLEWSGRYAMSGFLRQVSLSYAYMKTNKQSNGYISKYALDYMRHKATAGIEFRFLRYLSVTLIGGVYDRNGFYNDADGSEIPYKVYGLLDGRIAWERKHLRLYVDGNNITATRYCDFGGLKMPEGWFTGGIVVTY